MPPAAAAPKRPAPWATPRPQAGGPNRSSSRGFTLIELMIVMVVLTIVATATMARIGLHTIDSSYRTYTEDVYDALIFARGRAVDNQTRVIFSLSADNVEVEEIDPLDGTRTTLTYYGIGGYGGGIMKDRVCNSSMFPGVLAPGETRGSESSAGGKPSCASSTQQIIFQPDGSFAFQGQAGPPSGVTLLVIKTVNNDTMGALFEVYPGGNIRKVDNVQF